MISTVPNLPVILFGLVQLLMLVGLGLIVFVPFFPGLAVILAALLLYIGYASVMAGGLAGIAVGPLVGILIFGLAGLFSSWWSQKLGLNFTYVTPPVMMGAMLGSIVFVMVFQSMFWMLLGMIVGAFAMEMRQGRPFKTALHQGTAGLYSMLGPRGFQLVMAMLVIDLAVRNLHRVVSAGLLGTPHL